LPLWPVSYHSLAAALLRRGANSGFPEGEHIMAATVSLPLEFRSSCFFALYDSLSSYARSLVRSVG
jgi:hypothetical protein